MKTGEQLHIWGNHQVHTQVHTEITKIQQFQQLKCHGHKTEIISKMKSSNIALTALYYHSL